MRPLPAGTQAPLTPLHAPPNLKALPGLRWGGWASNSQGDLTDLRHSGAGTVLPPPRGDTESLLWDRQRTQRAQTPPQTPPPTSEFHAPRPQPPAVAGPSSPTSWPLQGPSAPWRPAGGAKPPSQTQGTAPLALAAWSGQRPPLPPSVLPSTILSVL